MHFKLHEKCIKLLGSKQLLGVPILYINAQNEDRDVQAFFLFFQVPTLFTLTPANAELLPSRLRHDDDDSSM